MLRYVFAVIGGIVALAVVNMMLVTLGAALIPAPPGVDLNDPASRAASAHLFEARHFVFPFLGHAAGAFAGATVAALLATTHKLWFAMGIGVLNLAGGIAAALMIPAPMTFVALDLALAYLPMAWLGWAVANRFSPPQSGVAESGVAE